MGEPDEQAEVFCLANNIKNNMPVYWCEDDDQKNEYFEHIAYNESLPEDDINNEIGYAGLRIMNKESIKEAFSDNGV